MNDPVKHCLVYKEIGCSHVDGYLCDYPDCSILKNYKMNERIKELKNQAWTLVSEEERARGELYEAREQWKRCDQKFAELIVRECMTICEDVAERNDPAIACYYEIKRTFRS